MVGSPENASRQVMRYYDRSSDELVGKLAAEPSDLGKVNSSGIRWTKLPVITRTDHLEVVHSVLRIDHRAIDCARRILAADSLREEVHRELIGLYMASGQTASALRQYRVCEELLQRELAVAPMPETQALLVRILAANQTRSVPDARSSTSVDSMSSALAEIAHELAASMALVQQAVAACDQAQARLQKLVAI